MRVFVYILIFTTISSKDFSLKELKILKSKLENHPVLKSTHRDKRSRKLYTENDFQTGSSYVQQMQDTNTNLNEMMGHSKRQQEIKQVGQWFADVEEKLDDFRDGVSRKLNELHMSLQRPKVPMIGPGPAMVMHPYQYNNYERQGLAENFQSPIHTEENSINHSGNLAGTRKEAKLDADDDMEQEMSKGRRRNI
jgi:hypothetical protein